MCALGDALVTLVSGFATRPPALAIFPLRAGHCIRRILETESNRQHSVPETKNAATGPKQPVKTIRFGRIKAAVWENEADQKKFYNVTFART
jgi:hypothetical protein